MSNDAIEVQGGLISRDFMERLRTGDVPGGKATDYVVPGRLEDAVTGAWNQLRSAWGLFQVQRSLVKTGDKDDAYRVTRDAWVRYVFDVLRYGHLVEKAPLVIEGKAYPIKFGFEGVPIQLVAYTQDLDEGPDGTARGNPHSQLQEYLNRSKSDAWGILTNGLRWRILRNNAASTRPAYIEFDLEAIMERFDEFTLWWRISHSTRITGETPWLEKWMLEADRQGTRALDDLRKGVKDAIEILGVGFLKHARNKELHQRLESGALTPQEYYHQVLRLVYRLIFLFVTEDRGLLLDPKAPEEARNAYLDNYGTQRLRRIAHEVRGSQHYDQFETLKVVMNGLKNPKGCTPLGIAGLNGSLWSKEFIPDLDAAHIRNLHFLQAIRRLTRIKRDKEGYQTVDYQRLASEELGGIYEGLLAYVALANPLDRTFRLETAAGNERKTTGSYYTPTSLVELTLEKAIDPVIEDRLKGKTGKDAERALLGIKVVDPTCGSGHFLVGAAHRIAKQLARVRTGEAEPGATDSQNALRDVIAHCIYGVDLNPMAVELCKVSLWLEAMNPGVPLVFLDQRIQLGNGFFGCNPRMLLAGVPAEAYKPLTLDNAVVCKEAKKANDDEIRLMGRHTRLAAYNESRAIITKQLNELDAISDRTIADIARKEALYRNILLSKEYHAQKLALDAYCAVWTQVKDGPEKVITMGQVLFLLEDPYSAPVNLHKTVSREWETHRFFHWHLAFPEVFQGAHSNPQTGWAGGFDVVIGNPPWERTNIKEEEWFGARRPEIASAKKASLRKAMIAALEREDATLFGEFQKDLRTADALSAFIRFSGAFPLTGQGDINTYAIFAENNRNIVSANGRVGCIVQTGICTDYSKREFFQDLVLTRSLVSITSFENEEHLFPGVHNAMKFCILAMTGRGTGPTEPSFSFYARSVEESRDPIRQYRLNLEQIRRINANSGTSPVFRSRQDADIAARIYERATPLIREDSSGNELENAWGIQFLRMLDMATDSNLFVAEKDLPNPGQFEGNVWVSGRERLLPLIEGKIFWQFDHRYSTYTRALRRRSGIPAESQSCQNRITRIPRTCLGRIFG